MKQFSWRNTLKVGVIVCSVLTLFALQRVRPAFASACGSPCYFIVSATASNTSSGVTIIDSPGFSNFEGLGTLLQVTQQFGVTYDPHPIGVWFNPSNQEWEIFNEDGALIPLGTVFLVEVTGKWTSTWDGTTWDYTQVTATNSNVSGDQVLIYDLETNNNPNALVFVTQDLTTTFDPHEIGAYYNPIKAKWTIFNEDKSAMPIGATFNLQVENEPGPYSSVTQATSTNISGYIAYGIGSSQVTQVYNANGVCGCVFNNHPIAVWYDGQPTPAIYNVDLTAMPVGAEFFVVHV